MEGSGFVRAYQVGPDETRAIRGPAEEQNGCLFIDQIRCVVIDPTPSDLDGCTVSFGSATRRGDVLVCQGGLVVRERDGKAKEIGLVPSAFEVEGWVYARSSITPQGTFWVSINVTRDAVQEARQKKRQKVDRDAEWDVYDQLYGYDDDEEEEEEEDGTSGKFRTFPARVVVELDSARYWGICAPGYKLGLWGTIRWRAPRHNATRVVPVAISARGAFGLTGPIHLDDYSYRGVITTVFSADHIVLDGDIHCLLCRARQDLLVGMRVQLFNAHPLWDGPALACCPFSTILITGFDPSVNARGNAAQKRAPLPKALQNISIQARIWLSFWFTQYGSRLLSPSEHVCRALLYAANLSDETIEPQSVSFLGHSSQGNCPFYLGGKERLLPMPEPLESPVDMPSAVAPFPFTYLQRSGEYFVFSLSTPAMPVSLMVPSRFDSPTDWLVCLMASQSDAMLMNLSTGALVFANRRNHFVVSEFFSSQEPMHVPAKAFPNIDEAFLRAQESLLLGDDWNRLKCVCESRGRWNPVFGLSSGMGTLSCASDPNQLIQVRCEHVGLISISHLGSDGSLSCFSRVSLLSKAPACRTTIEADQEKASAAAALLCAPDVQIGIIVRVNERSVTVDTGQETVKLIIPDSIVLHEGQSVRFRVTARHSAAVTSYTTSPSSLLVLLERLRRGSKLPPCPAPQILGKMVVG